MFYILNIFQLNLRFLWDMCYITRVYVDEECCSDRNSKCERFFLNGNFLTFIGRHIKYEYEIK